MAQMHLGKAHTEATAAAKEAQEARAAMRAVQERSLEVEVCFYMQCALNVASQTPSAYVQCFKMKLTTCLKE